MENYIVIIKNRYESVGIKTGYFEDPFVFVFDSYNDASGFLSKAKKAFINREFDLGRPIGLTVEFPCFRVFPGLDESEALKIVDRELAKAKQRKDLI